MIVKQIWIGLVLFVVTAGTMQAQSIGNLAREERKRQEGVTPTKVIREIAATIDVKKDAKKEIEPESVAPEAKPAEPKPAPGAAELAELQQEKAGLLSRLIEVIRDRKAVQDIDRRLGEIQKRSDELKQEAASKTDSQGQ